MNAAWQFGLLRVVMPIMSGVEAVQDAALLRDIVDLRGFSVLMSPLAQLSDADLRAVTTMCAEGAERELDGAWQPASFAGLGLLDLVAVLRFVADTNLRPALSVKRPEFPRAYGDGPNYEPVAMPDGDDWLFRPVLRGMCRLESLYDGTLQLEHIARANCALDVMDENERRAHKAAQQR